MPDTLNPFPQNDDQKYMYWKTFDSQRWGFLSWGMNRVKSALDKQVKPILESLENSPQEAIANIPLVSTKPIEDVFLELYGFVGGRFARQVNDSLKSHIGQYRTKQDDEEGFFVRTIREWIKSEGLPRINGITENTRNHLRQALETGIDEGMGIEEIARMISGSRKIAGIQRARVIARTEIISASNKGSLEGAKQLGLDLDKEWIATRDDRTRRTPNDKYDHWSADGQTVGINEKFIIQGRTRSEGLRFPGDPAGSPGNVIMCRCTQGYARK